jgi:ABC-2 type transport system permease protein
MTRLLSDVACVFRIHLARLRAEAAPFLLASLVFPGVMYMFATAIGSTDTAVGADPEQRVRFLAGSVVFSLSLTAVTWLGYLLLENRFTGRLKLFATLPLAPSSYVLGVVLFALAQGALGTAALLAAIVLLSVLCVCGIAVIVASRARSFSEGSLLTDALGAGLVFLAPVYCMPDALPRILQFSSRVFPTTYAARGVRTVLSGGTDVGADITILAAMAAITLAAGFRAMRWRED